MRIRNRWAPLWFLWFCAFVISRFSYGSDFEMNKSTNTNGTSTLSVVPRSGPGDVLGSVLINSRSSGAETLTLYDSSGTATNIIGVIDLSTGTAPTGASNTANQYYYSLRISSAITFSKSAGTSNVTIIWRDIK